MTGPARLSQSTVLPVFWWAWSLNYTNITDPLGSVPFLLIIQRNQHTPNTEIAAEISHPRTHCIQSCPILARVWATSHQYDAWPCLPLRSSRSSLPFESLIPAPAFALLDAAGGSP